LALKQLVATNPGLYDPIAVDTAALQALGWSNPQQFMIPASAQGAPPPEMIQAQAKMANDQMNSQARMLDSQTRAKEAQDRLQLDHMRLQMEMNQNQGPDPEKQAQIQTQQMEIQQRSQDSMLDAVNRKRDRESRERLAAIKLAEELMKNPGGLATAQSVLDPQMLSRLEGNEPTLDGTQTGEL
jgi:hypothetical protein